MSCLWNLILSLKCLYKLSQLWTTWLPLPDDLSCTASVLGLCWESSFWIGKKKGGGEGTDRHDLLFHFVWQLLNGKFPFPLHFFFFKCCVVMVLPIWQLQQSLPRTLLDLRVGKLNFLCDSSGRDVPVGLQSPTSWKCLNYPDLRTGLWEEVSHRSWFCLLFCCSYMDFDFFFFPSFFFFKEWNWIWS